MEFQNMFKQPRGRQGKRNRSEKQRAKQKTKK